MIQKLTQEEEIVKGSSFNKRVQRILIYSNYLNFIALLMRFILTLFCIGGFALHASSQAYVFAQLNGTPLNTSGWTLSGAAQVTNVTGTGNGELLLCPAAINQSGGIFFNQPINLSACNKWTAEFDFRIFDGNGADGIAFCFLDVPPSGFVSGGGLGIPGTANGLKVCFDTYLNCSSTGFVVPKLEIRWGAGYDECWPQPTLDNSAGNLSGIRSPQYARAKIHYNNGSIQVYINNVLMLTGFQQFSFTGYLGFTAATGSLTDNHSIKDVVIYTEMPPSEAGNDATICSGQSLQIGTASNLLYAYTWTPANDISNPNIGNPVFSFVNTTGNPVVKKLYVQTAYTGTQGCTSKDSITITVLPAPSLTISTNTSVICQGVQADFFASLNPADPNATIQWFVNGNPSQTGDTYSTTLLNDGDMVSAQVSSSNGCPASVSNSITMNVSPLLTPSVVIQGNTNVCKGESTVFNASVVNGGSNPVYQWMVNGNVVSTNSSFSSTALQDGDQVSCMINSNAGCINNPVATSNLLTIVWKPEPDLELGNDRKICEGNSFQINPGNFTSYLWQDGSTAPVYLAGTTGLYHVTVTNAAGCSKKDSLNITVQPNPRNFLPGDSSFCKIVPFNLTMNGWDQYLWNTGETGNSIFIQQPGMYWLEVTDNNGCKGKDSIQYILTNCSFEIWFPDAFSPNGDGKNDLFKPIVSNTLKHYSFSVYNRWGQVVFQSANPSLGWNGSLQGKAQPTGIYIWTCSYQFERMERKLEKGSVLLIR